MLGDVVEARAAPVRVVTGGAPADQSHHRRCSAGEGRGAEPAARTMRQEPEDPAIAALAGAADGQELVPEGLIARIGRRLLIAHGGPPTSRRTTVSAGVPQSVAGMEAIFLPLSILQAAKAADLGGTQRHRGASS